jgi:hypothetical protein
MPNPISTVIPGPTTIIIGNTIQSIEAARIRDLIHAVVAISRTNQKSRDKLAHHVWGICTQLPDALLLADYRAMGKEEVDYDNIYVYRANDFEAIIADNVKLCQFGRRLIRLLNSRDQRDRDRIYERLANEPMIAALLSELKSVAIPERSDLAVRARTWVGSFHLRSMFVARVAPEYVKTLFLFVRRSAAAVRCYESARLVTAEFISNHSGTQPGIHRYTIAADHWQVFASYADQAAHLLGCMEH